jgi:error-prone DNA polymerase
MVERGYEASFAQRCFNQIKGFGEYGFPESHAASFAHLVYVSSWLKCYYPAVFAAALLNSQPMGFYAPAQIVRDAREHGVDVRAPDVNFSAWDSTLEGNDEHPILRLGLREVDGLKEADAQLIKASKNVSDLHRIGVPVPALEKLSSADAFRSVGLDRRAALWGGSGDDRCSSLMRMRRIMAMKIRLPKCPFPNMSCMTIKHSSFLKAHPWFPARPLQRPARNRRAKLKTIETMRSFPLLAWCWCGKGQVPQRCRVPCP